MLIHTYIHIYVYIYIYIHTEVHRIKRCPHACALLVRFQSDSSRLINSKGTIVIVIVAYITSKQLL